jgi:hypothetical protein
MARGNSTFVYPYLGSHYDLWYARLSGHGLGNCFYSYFHAAVLAHRAQVPMIFPAWFSLKVGPLLRGDSSKRFYLGIFRPPAGEISGLHKFGVLAARYPARHMVDVSPGTRPELLPGRLNVVTARRFTFEGLHAQRALIRARLLGMLRDAPPAGLRFGQGDYIAVHVRLGDFAAVADPAAITASQSNTRIPLDWYVRVISALKARYPDKKIHVFSDGQDSELRPLLALGASTYRSGSDINDLLAMAGASVLAAFLGDMPSVWLQRDGTDEKPSAVDSPIAYVPLDAAHVALWS